MKWRLRREVHLQFLQNPDVDVCPAGGGAPRKRTAAAGPVLQTSPWVLLLAFWALALAVLQRQPLGRRLGLHGTTTADFSSPPAAALLARFEASVASGEGE